MNGKTNGKTDITSEFLNQCSYQDFHGIIFELGGVPEICIKMLDMIREMAFSSRAPLSFEETSALKVLCIYFSLIDDGNTCIALDSESLSKKWRQKWSGLVIDSQERNGSCRIEDEDGTFRQIIESGISVLKNLSECGKSENKKMPKLIFDFADKEITGETMEKISSPFVSKSIGGVSYLFTTKFFDSKVAIERRMKSLFHDAEENSECFSDSEIEKTISHFESKTGISLNTEQSLAVVRGKKTNLIITGGPGSGKTTAVCFLLWNLLKETDCDGVPLADYGIYLAAPSGKAAYRMKESISSSLTSFRKSGRTLSEDEEKIEKKLLAANPYTIHRLLGFNPAKNSFSYDEKNQFDKKSVFIIDEASMLDINMFASLLLAIPDGARLFILGDKDQLPSVDAGAVLSEIIGAFPKNVIRLEKSNRFSDDSEIGRLRKAIVDGSESFVPKMQGLGTWIDEKAIAEKIAESSEDDPDEKYPVYFSDIGGENERTEIENVVGKWAERFYEKIAERFISGKFDREKVSVDELRVFFGESLRAKILCAQRSGARGCEAINAIVQKKIAGKFGKIDYDGKYFSGQILMLTKNQRLFDLFNGDGGIVVTFSDDSTKYLMVEKKSDADAHSEESTRGRKSGEGIFRIGEFMFYPLHLLPSDSTSPSYAMTIHKSQGSGYANIMIFLPKKKGHPLLNNQIFYTAVTRTEGKTFVISSEEAMNAAKQNIIVRESKLEF